jgi:hypothetical protein
MPSQGPTEGCCTEFKDSLISPGKLLLLLHGHGVAAKQCRCGHACSTYHTACCCSERMSAPALAACCLAPLQRQLSHQRNEPPRCIQVNAAAPYCPLPQTLLVPLGALLKRIPPLNHTVSLTCSTSFATAVCASYNEATSSACSAAVWGANCRCCFSPHPSPPRRQPQLQHQLDNRRTAPLLCCVTMNPTALHPSVIPTHTSPPLLPPPPTNTPPHPCCPYLQN